MDVEETYLPEGEFGVIISRQVRFRLARLQEQQLFQVTRLEERAVITCHESQHKHDTREEEIKENLSTDGIHLDFFQSGGPHAVQFLFIGRLRRLRIDSIEYRCFRFLVIKRGFV